MFNILYILLAVLGLGFLVFIHELGHYFFAKKVGMKIEVFSIGFGKAIYSWNRNGVKWQVCILPFGGYVKIAGMEKQGSLEPYQIKDGFFAKKPIDRIKVALAGPVVNILFALLAFLIIWIGGGRNKPFSEYTQKIGGIDPKSELYTKGVRVGDEIDTYQNRPYRGFKDLLYASVLKKQKCEISGDKIDYYKNVDVPFDYNLNTYKMNSSLGSDINTIGITAPTGFLVYDGKNTDLDISPMKDSGIKNRDRIVWANGNVIFSLKQLSEILNDNFAFLTMKRNGAYFHVKIPKIKIEDVNLTKYDLEEIDDRRHFYDIQGSLKDIYFLPYYFTEDGTIENKLEFIDEELGEKVFSFEKDDRDVFAKPLQRGDKIVAIDGIKLTDINDPMKILQDKHALIIVQRNVGKKKVLWKDADKYFDKVFEEGKLYDLVSSIGRKESKSFDDLIILNPVVPVSMEQLANRKGVLAKKFAEGKKLIAKIDNEGKRKEILENYGKEKKLGIVLLDKTVKYNPNPLSLFYLSSADIWKTLSSLVSGKLSPKWMAGPIGIMQVMHQSWSLGFFEALFWLGVISLNLGVINLLPIPVLDGGHVVLSFVEMATKKPIKAKTMEKLIVPFIILIALAFLFFTYNDILRWIKMFF